MDGAASDLRTGLPWQMVEIHEPVRLLFVIETTPEAMLGIMDRNAGDRPALPQRLGPARRARPRTRGGQRLPGRRVPAVPAAGAVLPRAASSVDWYRGWRDHLEFAEIGKESHAR